MSSFPVEMWDFEKNTYPFAMPGYEFVQGAWMNTTKFDGLSEESDPLLGNREAVQGCPISNTFSQPRENALRERRNHLPQFVTVRGGAYFFLPSIRALKYFATVGS